MLKCPKIVSVRGFVPDLGKGAPGLDGFSRELTPTKNISNVGKGIYKAPNASIFLILKCSKIVSAWGSAPDPAGKAYNAPPYPLKLF